MTSREFNQDTARAKRLASEGPVVITDRGKPVHVLLSYDAYQKIAEPKGTIVDALAMKGDIDIDVEFEPLRGGFSLKIPEFD